ncbi:MAG: PTS sugar transporter subunit IIA [Kiloniellales bacterium]|nr:PTS sugar transporter subunit IIA [Kiloniellales bacterium]
MIGLVLVTHGGLAREFLAAVEHVVGPQERVAVVCIGPDDDIEERREQIIDGVAQVDEGDGVVVVTDMFGGTPSNLAISVLDQGHVEVIAGMNLPMLIKLASLRGDKAIGAVVAEAREAGRKYINVASELLAGEAAAKVKK